MPTELVEVKRRGVPAIVHLYRFFTGHHLDGKRRQHRQSGKVLPAYRDYYWNRYGRGKRALIRNIVFWFVSIFGFIFWRNQRLAEWLLCAFLPFAGWWVCRKARKHFFVQTSTTDSDGVPEVYWHLRPKYYRRVQKLRARRVKLSPPASDVMPAEFQRPTLAAIAEDGGDPVTSLRMATGVEQLIASEAKPTRKRGRNYGNANRKRA